MRAYICKGYGKPEDVLELAEVPTPTPKDHEILVRIRATAVNSGDSRVRRADPFLVRLVMGFTRPRNPILGLVLAGEVSAIGKNVTRYKVGDKIFGMSYFEQMGAFAEYICVDENGRIALLPGNMDMKEAVALPFGGHTALDFFKKAALQRGQKVLVNGASGAVGAAAVQLAKYYGAVVTGVCSGPNTDLVASIGADVIIDYTKTPLAQIAERYDVVFDTIGKNSAFDLEKLVAPGGTLILGSMVGPQTLAAIWLMMTRRNKKIIGGTVKVTGDDMEFLRQRAEAGEMQAVIDSTYPFEEMIAAHQRVDSGRKRGNVIVTME